MNIAQYRALFGAELPAMSLARRRSLSKTGKEYFADFRNRLARRAKKRAELSDWDLVVLFVSGLLKLAIAKKYGRKRSGIWRRAQQLGFSGRDCLYDIGQPCDSEWARSLKSSSGLSVGEFETAIDVPKGGLTALFYPHGQQRNKPQTAKRLIAWRDRTLTCIVTTDFRKRPGAFPRCKHKADCIPTLIPKFRNSYLLLVSVLRRLQNFLRANPKAGIEEVKAYLCEEARLNVANRSREGIFRRFLPWAPQLIDLMKRDLDRLRGTERLECIACDWLAFRWSSTRGTVQAMLRQKTPTLTPNEMAGVIRSFAMYGSGSSPIPREGAGAGVEVALRPNASAVQGPRRGRGRPSNRPRLEKAEQLHKQGLTWSECAKAVEYSGFSDDLRAAAERLRIAVKAMKRRRSLMS